MARRTSPRAEDRSQALDELAQEHGAGLTRSGRRARDWIHTTHPDTGLSVVFKAGELLPEWAPAESDRPP